MRKSNSHGNTHDTIFWSAPDWVIDMDTGTGSHQRRNAAVYEETTNKILYAPYVLSVKKLVDKAKELLTETDAKKEGVDFLLPSLSWVYLQLSPSHENRKTAERYAGKLPFKRMILSRTDRDSAHLNAHWVAGLKKYWRHHTSNLCRLIVDAPEMAEEKDSVDIQPLLPHSDAIMYLGQEDK